MTRRFAVRPAFHGGLDRFLAGQAELCRDVHRWVTARGVTERRWHTVAARHGGVAAAAAVVVAGRGLPVAAAGLAWAVAACRRAPEPPAPDAVRREAYLRLFAAVIGGRNGVHVGELYATLRRYDHWTHRTDAELRALVDDLGVPVRRTMRVGDVTGRSGIRLADVQALKTGVPVPYPTTVASPSPEGEEAGHSDVELSVEGAVEPVSIVVTRPDDEPAWPPSCA